MQVGAAEQVVIHGYWRDEDGQGVNKTVTLEPVRLTGQSGTTPNLKDPVSFAHIQTKVRTAKPDLSTGYYAVLALASNDPDVDAYGGRKVTFAGYDPFIVQVPFNAPTATVDSKMAAQVPGLSVGATVRAVWMVDAPTTAAPPTPASTYYTSEQVNSLLIGQRQVPAGGTTGQVLTRGASSYGWADATGGGGGGAPTGGAGGVLSGSFPNPGFAQDMATQGELDAVDAAKLAKTANLSDVASAATARTNLGVAYGTTAGTVAQGNDPRMSDPRAPADGSVTDAKVATGAAISESKLTLASDAAPGTASRRTLGTGATQAAAGNDARLSDARGWALYSGAATSGQVPMWNGSGFVPASVASGASVSDATSSAKGIIQLTNDLGGTATAPTVPALASKAPLASPTFTGTPRAPRFVTDPVTLSASSGAITPDASASSLFRHTATTAVTLNEPTGGVDGQEVVVEVLASGADRVLSFAGGAVAAVTIPVGQRWSGRFRYDSSVTTWSLVDGSTGSNGAVSSVNGRIGPVTGLAEAADVSTSLAGKQPLDSDLTAIAALDAAQAGVLASEGSGWVRRTYAQIKTSLGLVKADVGLDQVSNLAPADLPVSTAQQTAINARALALTPLAAPVTSATTSAANQFVPVDASAASVPITLPTAPADRTRVAVKLIAVSGSYTATFTCGGSDVFNKVGGPTTVTLSLLNQGLIAQYQASAGIWYVQSTDIPLSQLDARFSVLGHKHPVSDLNTTGTASSTTYLRGDGTWATPVSGGTVPPGAGGAAALYGAKAMGFDPGVATNTFGATQVTITEKLYAAAAITVNTVLLCRGDTAGSGHAGYYVAVHDSTGALLGQSADMSSLITGSDQPFSVPLLATANVPAGVFYLTLRLGTSSAAPNWISMPVSQHWRANAGVMNFSANPSDLTAPRISTPQNTWSGASAPAALGTLNAYENRIFWCGVR